MFFYYSTVPAQLNRLGSKSFNIEGGKISWGYNKSVNQSGIYDFVITKENQLLIGDGHYKMAGYADEVNSAGTIRIGKNGKIETVTNNSGHYPGSSENLKYAEKFFNENNLTSNGYNTLDISKSKKK